MPSLSQTHPELNFLSALHRCPIWSHRCLCPRGLPPGLPSVTFIPIASPPREAKPPPIFSQVTPRPSSHLLKERRQSLPIAHNPPASPTGLPPPQHNPPLPASVVWSQYFSRPRGARLLVLCADCPRGHQASQRDQPALCLAGRLTHLALLNGRMSISGAKRRSALRLPLP